MLTSAKTIVRSFHEKSVALLKGAMFLTILLYGVQSDASGPSVFVEKKIEARQTHSSYRDPLFRKCAASLYLHLCCFHAAIMGRSFRHRCRDVGFGARGFGGFLNVDFNSRVSTFRLADNASLFVLKVDNPASGAAWFVPLQRQ